MPDPHQQPGGFPAEYQAKRPRFDPAGPEGLNLLIYDWVSERRVAIKRIREHGERIGQGMLDRASASMSDRWVLTSVGNSAAAWIERACTFSAMLLDFRSRQFGRRVINEQTDERSDLDRHLDLMRLSHTRSALRSVATRQSRKARRTRRMGDSARTCENSATILQPSGGCYSESSPRTASFRPLQPP